MFFIVVVVINCIVIIIIIIIISSSSSSSSSSSFSCHGSHVWPIIYLISQRSKQLFDSRFLNVVKWQCIIFFGGIFYKRCFC